MATLKGMYRRGSAWWLRHTPVPGGKQVRVSLGTDIEQVAAVKAMQILHSAPLERAGEFEEEMERYFAESAKAGRLSATTIAMRRTVLGAFARFADGPNLSLLSVGLVERWVAVLQEGGGGKGAAIQPGTVRSYVFHLRAFFGWLVRRGRMRENPAAGIELGKVERQVSRRFVVSAVVRRLIETAPDDDLRFVLFCGFHAGMRKLEIVEASPGWFHLEPEESKRRGRITIAGTATFTPKDRDARTVPLTLEFEAFLRVHLARLPAGAKWALRPGQGHGRWRYRYDFRKPFAEHLKSQGVEATPHDMRRSFVSNRLIADSSLIFKLAKWTGDDVRTLQAHYAHLLADDEDIEAGV